ncbi:STAS domain-containing protein [Telluria beijingensis]|uniref:STAS domain-containing protein n=1 Tax=Telluria beijingensis TaxID=3068633 RepID=UPI0027953353|nr:STAS domain-containing protein [Massilia sp. REN29]
MGLFSFLKRKNDDAGGRDWPPPESRLRGEPSRLDTEAERERQREIARATAAKIDEIELAFASDMFDDEPAWGSGARQPANGLAQREPDVPAQAALPASAPAVEESAILYANGQPDVAEHLLRAALPTLGRHERLPWWMLFDLYQADGREDAFESVAIDYASHFETSPPAWKPLPAATGANGPGRASPFGAALATVETFGPTIDTSVAAPLARVLDAAAPVARLDFGRVAAIDADGAACLLAALQGLRRTGRELVLAGADTLLATLRPMLVIGRRDASPAPWLLLLELLLLTDREKQFEEAAMDYCVTYEVSPPSFEAPLRVSTAAPAPDHGDRFMLPASIGGPDDALLSAIDAYAQERETLVLDCSRLARIDYAGAGSLLARLDAHAAAGRGVELRELNHLVTTLLRLLGAGDNVRLYPHRY